MHQSQLEHYQDVSIGDEITICPDSGFGANQTIYNRVRGITLVQWTHKEQLRLNVPREEAIILCYDGSTAHFNYDRVRLLHTVRND